MNGSKQADLSEVMCSVPGTHAHHFSMQGLTEAQLMPSTTYTYERSPSPGASSSPPEQRHAAAAAYTALNNHLGSVPGIGQDAGDRTSVGGSSRIEFHAGGSNGVAASAELRTFVHSDNKRPGLESGDVVMLLSQGRTYNVVQVPSSGHGGTAQYQLELSTDPAPAGQHLALGQAQGLGTSQGQTQPQTPTSGHAAGGECHRQGTAYLEVVRQGPFLGLRSSAAGQRFVQPRRKAPHLLLLFSDRLGVWEQWEVSGEEWRAPWSSLQLRLRSRRLPQVELQVLVVRVGQYLGTPPLSQGFRTPRTTSVASEQLSWTPGVSGTAAGSEDEHLKRLSGLFMHEWLRFVEHERQQRLGVERDMQGLLEQLADIKMDTIAQVETLRCEMGAQMAALSDALQQSERQAAAQKLGRRRAIEAAVAAAWRRTARHALRQAYDAWRAYVEFNAVLRTAMVRAVARLARRRLAAALAAWRMHVQRRLAVRAMMIRAVRWASERKYRRVLCEWASWVRSRKDKQRHIELADAVAARRAAALAMDAWRDWLTRKRQGREGQEAAAARARRMLQRKALAAWRDTAHAAVERGETALACARSTAAAAALAAWREAAAAKATQRCAQDRALRWHRRRLLRGAWQALMDAAKQAVTAAHAAAQLQQQHGIRQCRRVLQAWQELTAIRLTARRALHRMARRFDLDLLQGVWHAWRQQVHATACISAHIDAWAAARQWATATAVLQGWSEVAAASRRRALAEVRWSAWYSRRLVRRALQAWQDHTAAKAGLRRLGAKLGLRRRQALLRSCLLALQQQVQDTAQRSAVLAACAERWHRAHIALALERWRGLAVLRTQERLLRISQLQQATRSAMAVALGSWWGSHSRVAPSTAAAAQAAAPGCPDGANVSPPMTGQDDIPLKAIGDATAYINGSVEDAAGDLCQRGQDNADQTPSSDTTDASGNWRWLLSVYWQAWRQQCQAATDRAAASNQLRRDGEARRVADMLIAWHAQVQSRARQRMVVACLLQRHSHRLQSRTLAAWADHHTELRAKRDAAELMASAVARRRLQAVLAAWAATAVAVHRLRLLGARLSQAHRLRATRTYFDAWRTQILDHLEQKDRLRACIKSKKVAFAHFKQWYWESFDTDVQDTIRRVFQTTEHTVRTGDTPWPPSVRQLQYGPPSAAPGLRAPIFGYAPTPVSWAQPLMQPSNGEHYAGNSAHPVDHSRQHNSEEGAAASRQAQYHQGDGAGGSQYPEVESAGGRLTHQSTWGDGLMSNGLGGQTYHTASTASALPAAASLRSWAFGSRLGSAQGSGYEQGAPATSAPPQEVPFNGKLAAAHRSGDGLAPASLRPPAITPLPAWRVPSLHEASSPVCARVEASGPTSAIAPGMAWGRVSTNVLFDDELGLDQDGRLGSGDLHALGLQGEGSTGEQGF